LIDFVKGNINHLGEGYIVIENNGIGYKINTSQLTISELNKEREDVIIYTEMIVREDDISLYGFSTRSELQMFQLLTTVNGIGTKVALGILSSFRYMDLASIILQGNVIALTKAPGVGKKTAQRIILELKDKIDKKIDLKAVDSKLSDEYNNFIDDNSEALDALISLGYSRNEVKSVLGKLDTNLPIEELIKQALRLLMK